MSAPYYADDLVTLHLGDCLDVLREMEPGSVDAVVCDPPYAIGFMGKEWDSPGKTFVERKPDRRNAWDHVGGNHNPADSADQARTRRAEARKFQQWCEAWAAECLRILKPGGWLLAFGGTRTWHRLACAIEDAGFEIRDSVADLTGQDAAGLMWVYGSGFPKSLDVSKAIDKAAGAERAVIGHTSAGQSSLERVRRVEMGYRENLTDVDPAAIPVTAPATEEAKRWQGWGTALKPAWEPIVVARKALAGTVAANVLEHGTGALNIGGCRVQTGDPLGRTRNTALGVMNDDGWQPQRQESAGHDAGRWPPNVLLAHAEGCRSTGCTVMVKPNGGRGALPGEKDTDVYGKFGKLQRGAGNPAPEPVEVWECMPGCPVAELDAQSGLSTPRGHTPARRGGLGYGGSTRGTESLEIDYGTGGASRFFPVFRYEAKAGASERPRLDDGTAHPTVKPVSLLRWLVRLVTPPGGVVLDPFAGSGTTGEACVIEGFRSVLIERDPQYAELITTRLRKPIQPDLFGGAA